MKNFIKSLLSGKTDKYVSTSSSETQFVRYDNNGETIINIQKEGKNTKPLKKIEIDFQAFTNLENDTIINVVFAHVKKALFEYPENLEDVFTLNVENDTLTLKTRVLKRLSTVVSAIPTLTLPMQDLDNLANNGLGDVKTKAEVMGQIISKGIGNIDVGTFTGQRILLDSTGNITINQADCNSLDVKSNGIGDLTIKQGGVKSLTLEKTSTGRVKLDIVAQTFEVVNSGIGDVKMKEVQQTLYVENHSTGNVTVAGEMAQNVTLKGTGIGDIKVSNMLTQKLSASNESTGKITLSGEAQSVVLENEGIGDIIAENLKAYDVRVNSSSMGSVSITPLENVEVELSGMGDVKLKGNANLVSAQIDINSMGSVKANGISASSLLVNISGMGDCQIKKAAKKFQM